MIRLCCTIVLYITIHGHTFVWIEFRLCIQYENNMNILMIGLCSAVMYITIYGHTLFTYIFYHGNKAVCIEVRVAYNR